MKLVLTEAMKLVLTVAVMLLLILGLVWIIEGNNFFLAKVFSPKREEVRRQTFENSRAFIQGTIDDLRQDQRIWIKAGLEKNKEHQAMLVTGVLEKAGKIPAEKLPEDLQAWISKLRNERYN